MTIVLTSFQERISPPWVTEHVVTRTVYQMSLRPTPLGEAIPLGRSHSQLTIRTRVKKVAETLGVNIEDHTKDDPGGSHE